jgi:hypothetical protein
MRTMVANDVLNAPAAARELVIDFMYLDLETCTRCRGTEASLEAALAETARVLDLAGVAVTMRKTLVASVEEARAAGFVSSPTVRINGQDIAGELRESNCQECGEACGCAGDIDCRLWVWQGREYTEAPSALIVDAILRQVYGGAPAVPAPAAESGRSDNLERFFAGKTQHQAEASSCCSPAKQASCCESSHKASCCGDTATGGCGCQ